MEINQGTVSLVTEDGSRFNVRMAGDEKPDIANLQKLLVSCSMNHEYARQAYEQCRTFSKKQELSLQMDHLKSLYFATRDKLAQFHLDHLETVENELRLQKQTVFGKENLN